MKNFLDKYSELIGIILIFVILVSGVWLIIEKNNLFKNVQNQNVSSNNDELNNKISNIESRIKVLEDKNNPVQVTQSKQSSDKININTADETALDSLSGIGPSRAKSIIDYRTSHSGFKSISEIQNIKGIGASIYNQIKDQISI